MQVSLNPNELEASITGLSIALASDSLKPEERFLIDQARKKMIKALLNYR